MKKLRYVLIGCGRIAPNHLAAALANNDLVETVALCDLDVDNIRTLMDKCKTPDTIPFYTDYRKMLQEIKPELCAVATESGKHAAIALDCLNAHCHVMVEKPIALSMADAREMVAAAERNGVVLSVCHQNRFNKSIQKAREALEAGRFGRLMFGSARIFWNRGREYYDQAKWRGTWEQDGGALMNQCIHNIDLLRWFMGGDIEEVFAYTDRLNHDYIAGEDFGAALIKFKNGSYGVIEGTTDIYPQNLEETLGIFGSTGTFQAGGKSVNIIEEWRFADGPDDAQQVKTEFSENPPNVYGHGHTPYYRDVLEAIAAGRKPYITGRDGLRALELVLAIYKSQKEGRPVKLPLEDFSTLDMIGAFQ